MGQLLQEHAPGHFHFEHAAAKGAGAGLGRDVRPGRDCPCVFQPQPVLLAAPAAGGKQPAEDFADRLRSAGFDDPSVESNGDRFRFRARSPLSAS